VLPPLKAPNVRVGIEMSLHKPSRKGSSIVAIMIRNTRTYEHIHSLSANRGDSSSGKYPSDYETFVPVGTEAPP
jgi:hypothetical protein